LPQPLRPISVAIGKLFPYQNLGSEFMPPLYEGDLFYMPTTFPGISTTKARQILQQTDQIIKSFPEVHHVFGKVGRAETRRSAPLMRWNHREGRKDWPVDIKGGNGKTTASAAR
jgi:Cu(I)/Ag(I) efflux system membrane protein CusA/SilA